MSENMTKDTLVANLRDARARTIELVHGLDGTQLMGPRLDIVNPLLWEIGHLAWFHEFFILRRLGGREPILARTDKLYNSMEVHHDTRWDLDLPDLHGTFQYMRAVEDALIERLDDTEPVPGEDSYLYQLTTFHEDMHDEAFTYTRQTLGYPEPKFRTSKVQSMIDAGALLADVEVPGGTIELGSRAGGMFIFDNEKYAHEIEVRPFCIGKAPVTNAEFLAFVEDGGYEDERFWDASGRAWRHGEGARHPIYWRRGEDGGWWVKRFDGEIPLPPHHPVSHVSWHEANAWCSWAGRRLPSEAEWETAAAYDDAFNKKRRFPWGDEAVRGTEANLDGRYLGTVDVAAFPEGESA
ncbi:MAG: Hercynine oxygenase, partial [Alphaproteobacteria bacterium MarineAlpha4_Bin2]